jgi:hypothetical protein
MPRKRNPVIVAADAMDGMVGIVDELNRTVGKRLVPSAEALRGIVKQWQDSGPNLSKLDFSDPGLWKERLKAFRPTMISTKSGAARMNLLDNAPRAMTDRGGACVRFYAVCLFNSLVLNPLWQRLGGPCGRCDMYYVKSRLSQKLYCGARCASLVSAEKSTREKLDDDRADKLKRARSFIRQWDALKVRPDMYWKQWVHCADETITSKWLTRAINPKYNYGLQPPRKRRGR